MSKKQRGSGSAALTSMVWLAARAAAEVAKKFLRDIITNPPESVLQTCGGTMNELTNG
jgi:hypothetical protein